MYYLPSTVFKDLKFVQEIAKFNLFDPQQVDFLFEIMRSFNLVQKVENEKENFDRYVFGVPLLIENDTDKSLDSIWPKKNRKLFAGIFKNMNSITRCHTKFIVKIMSAFYSIAYYLPY